MTRKDEYLNAITRDVIKYDHIQDETKEKYSNVRCSEDLLKTTIWKAQKERDKIYDKVSYWFHDEAKTDAKKAIVRHLSCGERLDTDEGRQLIEDYHEAIEVLNHVRYKLEAEFAKL